MGGIGPSDAKRACVSRSLVFFFLGGGRNYRMNCLGLGIRESFEYDILDSLEKSML